LVRWHSGQHDSSRGQGRGSSGARDPEAIEGKAPLHVELSGKVALAEFVENLVDKIAA